MTRSGTSSDHPKVALITGSGRKRIGNVVARSLANNDYAIALHYRSSKEPAEQTAADLRQQGVHCRAYQANVCSEVEVDRMFDAIAAEFGRIDVLVTTASIWQATPLEKITAQDFRDDFDVNVLGTFLCARRAGFQMVKQTNGGSIITIGDWAIERPYLNHTPYFTSKGAIPTLTKTLAVEFASRNPKVTVNCIHPGPVLFPPDCADSERNQLVESTLVKNANDPQAIVSAVLFFAQNRFVTGTCLPVDGGRTIFASETESRKRPM